MHTSPERAGANRGHSRYFATLRRLYLYLVILICLIALQVHFHNLARDLAAYWGVLDGPYLIPTFGPLHRRLLANGSFLLTTALFLSIHYGLMAGWVRRDPRERDSPLRKLFLFTATLVALGYCISLVASLIDPALRQLKGMAPELSGFYGAHYGALALSLGFSGTILVKNSSLLHAERHCGMTGVHCQALEAIFFAVINVGSLLLLAAVVHTVLFRVGMPLLLNHAIPDYVRAAPLTVTSALATLVTLLLTLHQVAGWRLRLTQDRSHLWGDVLHILTLYGGLLTGLVIFLYGLLLSLQALLLSGLEAGIVETRLIYALLTILPLGAAYGLWFHRSLSQAPETARLAGWAYVPRQLYLYSGIGVALVWVAEGSHELILAFLNQGAVSDSLSVSPNAILDATKPSTAWAAPALAPLLIGGAALFLLWRQIRQLGSEPVAPAFRALHLLPRRLYLYGVTIIATLVLLVSSGQVLQELLEHLMGWHTVNLLSTGHFTRQAALLVVLGVILALHVRLLRRPWGPSPAVASPVAAEVVSLRQELAAAQAHRRQWTDRIQTLEQRLAALSAVESTENNEP